MYLYLLFTIGVPGFWQAHPPIKLKRPQFRLDKMAAKAMGGVGSAAKSVRRVVTRKPPTADMHGVQHSTGSGSGLSVLDRGAPTDSEARIVYVSTHAEGVTRVSPPPSPPHPAAASCLLQVHMPRFGVCCAVSVIRPSACQMCCSI